MHIHILGICGTFMAGTAVLAKQQGHHVTGSDKNVYPPMSTQLKEQGIVLFEGYDVEQLKPTPDLIIVGNAISRGNACVEYMLDRQLRYTSGPQWLAENILQNRWVLAVAGTHGKTTTTSLLSWILEHEDLNPGFLIGGIAKNFGVSARLGEKFFVIEADEYDTAFFDKRSKFIHYHPRTLILNNLEFDHADIFPNLDAIKTHFHHLVRTVPNNGLIVSPHNDENIKDVLTKGCWTPVKYIGEQNEKYQLQNALRWNLLGEHNIQNALAAIAAANHVGISTEKAIAALNKFAGIKRRMEICGKINNITVYDDFAHHPTAITTTLAGLRKYVGNERIIAIVELGSYTMRTGAHRDTIAPALNDADMVLIARPKDDWGVDAITQKLKVLAKVYNSSEEIIEAVTNEVKPLDHVLIMSNTGFDGIHEKLIIHLQKIYEKNA